MGSSDGIPINLILIVYMTGVDAWLKDETSCEEANEDILSVVEVDGKPVVFLLHESD